jgi:hypothetical protein
LFAEQRYLFFLTQRLFFNRMKVTVIAAAFADLTWFSNFQYQFGMLGNLLLNSRFPKSWQRVFHLMNWKWHPV